MTQRQQNQILKEALYCIANGATVREITRVYSRAKSTVHNDLTKKLPYINAGMASDVRKVLDKNLKERNIRGGEATKKKYSQK